MIVGKTLQKEKERRYQSAAELAARHGVRVILNPAPARPLPDKLLKLVSILTPNESEAEAGRSGLLECGGGEGWARRALLSLLVGTRDAKYGFLNV